MKYLEWNSRAGNLKDSCCDIKFSAVSPTTFLMHHCILFICFYCNCPDNGINLAPLYSFSQNIIFNLWFPLHIPSASVSLTFFSSLCWCCFFLPTEIYGINNIIWCNSLVKNSLHYYFLITCTERNCKVISVDLLLLCGLLFWDPSFLIYLASHCA